MQRVRTFRLSATATLRCVAVLAIAGALVITQTLAGAADTLDLDQAQEDRDDALARQQRLQGELDTLLSRIEELKVTREEGRAHIKRLDARLREQQTTAQQSAVDVAERYRAAYKHGTGADPLLTMFGADTVEEVAERARVLTLMAEDSRARQEVAESAAVSTEALSEQLQQATKALDERTEELTTTQQTAKQKVAQAQAEVEELDDQIAAEKARRAREARERAARQAAQNAPDPPTNASSGGGGAAPVSGGIACPVGQPRNYSDTYGAPRSGGRSHKGVDILAPIGTPSYAYENGTITRMDGNSLGGISLYLRGASGNLYYYTHLSGYRSGVSVGQQVSAGQHIAYVGDTGNAAGIPHLHWEVMPGGGGNVNPYPYALRACG